MENKNAFHYTYSASQQEEIRSIRKKYEEPEAKEDKMQKLRRLDQKATKTASIVGLTVGIIGTLLLGIGMSLVMSDFGEMLSENHTFNPLIGIGIGVLGILLAGCAYPFYTRIVKRERKKIAPEIIRLSDELMK